MPFANQAKAPALSSPSKLSSKGMFAVMTSATRNLASPVPVGSSPPDERAAGLSPIPIAAAPEAPPEEDSDGGRSAVSASSGAAARRHDENVAWAVSCAMVMVVEFDVSGRGWGGISGRAARKGEAQVVGFQAETHGGVWTPPPLLVSSTADDGGSAAYKRGKRYRKLAKLMDSTQAHLVSLSQEQTFIVWLQLRYPSARPASTQ